MFDVQFMVGTGLIWNIMMLVVAAFVAYQFLKIWKILVYTDKDTPIAKPIIKRVATIALVLLVAFFVSRGTVAPKVVIDTPPNKELQQYNRQKEVEIFTPPPRTENLKGFKPLKEGRE